jgi:hypothetical protein
MIGLGCMFGLAAKNLPEREAKAAGANHLPYFRAEVTNARDSISMPPLLLQDLLASSSPSLDYMLWHKEYVLK